MERVQNGSQLRGRAAWALLTLVVLLLAAGAIWKSVRSAASMSAVASSDETQFLKATAGSKVKVVIEIGSVREPGELNGTLLRKKTEETYMRTFSKATGHFNERTSVAMGKRDDIRGGAVIHITGTTRADRGIDGEQIVILTGYVHVE